jgi:hypothetical protein
VSESCNRSSQLAYALYTEDKHLRQYGGEMGCDEPVGSLVARAILTLVGMDWVAATPSQTQQRSGGRGHSPNVKSPTVSASEARRLTKAAPAPQGRTVTRATEAAVDARVEAWRQASNNVAIGNLGEQVAMRVLTRMGYEVLATQFDLKGAVPDIVGRVTRMNPEDFIVVDPNNRYTTVNAKATASESTARMTTTGDLSTPQMRKGQNLEQYYSTRSELLSPLDGGKSFGQVMKVDLVHKLAQVFEIDPNGQLSPMGKPVDVLADIVAVCDQNPAAMPAPTGPNVAPQPATGDGP